MQLLAIGLAASLLIGPAPVTPEPGPELQADAQAEAELEADADADADNPAVEASAEASVETPEVEAEPEAEPEPEPEPEVEAEPEPPTGDETTVAISTAPVAKPPTEPVVRDGLGCGGHKPCRKMTIAGIVVSTLGVAAVGTGIGLLIKRDEVLPETPTFITSTRPAGLVALTVGAGVAITGMFVLLAAHKGYRQRDVTARRIQPIANGFRF